MMTTEAGAGGVGASVGRRFDLDFVAIAVPRRHDWDVHSGRGEDRARSLPAVNVFAAA
jgi:hypothetical protein